MHFRWAGDIIQNVQGDLGLFCASADMVFRTIIPSHLGFAQRITKLMSIFLSDLHLLSCVIYNCWKVKSERREMILQELKYDLQNRITYTPCLTEKSQYPNWWFQQVKNTQSDNVSCCTWLDLYPRLFSCLSLCMIDIRVCHAYTLHPMKYAHDYVGLCFVCTEPETLTGWQPWYSLETLKLAFNVSSEY